MSKFFVFLTYLFLLTVVAQAETIPGSLDESFPQHVYCNDPTGPTLRRGLTCTAIQPDGRILVGGEVRSVGEVLRRYIARLNPDGSLDRSFEASLPCRPNAIAVMSDGKILVGSSSSDHDILIRLHPDGSRDTSFETPDGIARCILPLADGTLFVAGQTITSGLAYKVIKFKADGSVDTSFNASFNSFALTLAMQPDGKLLVGGQFSYEHEGQRREGLMRLLSSGNRDESFSPHFTYTNSNFPDYQAHIYSLIVKNEEIWAAGRFTHVNGAGQIGLARLSLDGALQPSAQVSILTSLVAETGGGFVLGGRHKIERLGTDGILAPSFDKAAQETPANCISAVQSDGKILRLSGSYNFTNSTAQDIKSNMLVRLENVPASHFLTLTEGGGGVRWTRGGSAPWVSQVIFECFSTENGWQLLGPGTPTGDGGWEIQGVTLPPQGEIRARGRVQAGIYNGSSSLLEDTHLLGEAQPRLLVKGAAGTELANNGNGHHFTQRLVPETFTVTNTGSAPLTLLGAHVSNLNFVLDTTRLPGRLEPGEQASLTVTMVPTPKWGKAAIPFGPASLRISSNDAATPDFSVQLSGEELKSANTNLTFLRVGGRMPLEWAQPGLTEYVVKIRNTSYEVRFEFYLEDPYATVMFQGEPAWPGSPYWGLGEFTTRFRGRTDVVSFDVIAADGVTSKTYQITLIRDEARPGDFDWDFNREITPTSQSPSSLSVMPGARLIADKNIHDNTGKVVSSFPTLQPRVAFTHVLPDDRILVGYHAADTFDDNSDQGAIIGADHQEITPLNLFSSTAGEEVCMLPLPDGRILVGISRPTGSTFSPVSRTLIRLNSDGTRDPTFITSIKGDIYTLVYEGNNHIIVGGRQLVSDSTAIVRLNLDGSLAKIQPSTQPTMGEVRMIEAASGGQWLVGGRELMRYNADWSQDTDFATIFSNDISFAVQADGSFHVSSLIMGYRKHHADGTQDTGFSASYSKLEKALALQEDGKLIISERSSAAPANGLARYENTVATQQLSVVNAATVRWMRGGSSPEARRVYVELSTDDGTTWTYLADAARIPGGWEASGLRLPAQGKVRTRAVIGSGYRNLSTGILEAISEEFHFPAPALAVKRGAETLSSGTTLTFDPTAIKSGDASRLNLAVHNVGGTHLNGVTVTLTGRDAGQFKLVEKPEGIVLAANPAALVVEFKPKTKGLKICTLTVTAQDGGEPVVLTLTGNAVSATPPLATTQPATEVGFDQATLRATITSNGADQKVSFEYGPTKSYGQSVSATPAQLAGNAVSAEVSTVLTGLKPHTTYHYRVTSSGILGDKAGKKNTFITANRNPIATPDQWDVTPGLPSLLDILTNDTDADGDTLSLHSFTSLSPATAGRLTKKGARIELATASNYTGTATFTYRAKDAFGGVSEPATVTLGIGTFDIPAQINVPALATTPNVTMGTQATWKVTSAPKWITIDRAAESAQQTLSFTVADNYAKNPRKGVLILNKFYRIEILQSGAKAPVINFNGLDIHGSIGNTLTYQTLEGNEPARVTTSKLPLGLTLKGSLISGVPTQAGSYEVTVNASNGSSRATTVRLQIKISGYAGPSGQHEGLLPPLDNGTTTGKDGAHLSLNVTAAGSCSGSLTLGRDKFSFKGLMIQTSSETSAQIQVPLLVKKSEVGHLTVNLTPSGLTFDITTAQGTSSTGTGSKVPWNGDDQQATAFAGRQTFYLQPWVHDLDRPKGTGHGSFLITAKTGAVLTVGRLADGTAFTCGSFVSPSLTNFSEGSTILYQAPYSNGGYVSSRVTLKIADSSSSTLDWDNPTSPPYKKTLDHPEGLRNRKQTLYSAPLPSPLPGEVVLGLENGVSRNAWILFEDGGLPTPREFAVTISNPNQTGIQQTATVESPADFRVEIKTLDATQGTFSGTLLIPGPNKKLDRNTPFQGQLVLMNGAWTGVGQFLLPELPVAGQTLKNAPLWSGSVILSPAE